MREARYSLMLVPATGLLPSSPGLSCVFSADCAWWPCDMQGAGRYFEANTEVER
jgi:hypothetical protein